MYVFSSSDTSSINVSVSHVVLGQSFVESGFALLVNVTVQNNLDVSDVANVELLANSTSIFNETLNLDSLTSRILTCSVNTAGLSIGNYTITASAVSLGEPNAVPSTMSGGTVGVTYVGDLNGDFQVNFQDIAIFCREYIAYFTSGTYYPAIDYTHSGIINFNDLSLFEEAYVAYWTRTPFSGTPSQAGMALTVVGSNLENSNRNIVVLHGVNTGVFTDAVSGYWDGVDLTHMLHGKVINKL
jgi:hypothetical protein